MVNGEGGYAAAIQFPAGVDSIVRAIHYAVSKVGNSGVLLLICGTAFIETQWRSYVESYEVTQT